MMSTTTGRTLFLSAGMLAFSAHAEVLYDLNVGAEWFYETEGMAAENGVARIDESRTVDGITWYRLYEFGDVFWVRNGEGGQIEAFEVGEDGFGARGAGEEVLVFRYPTEPGDSWEFHGTQVIYLGVQSMDVPAGSFDCHAYHLDMGEGDYSLSCFAAEVGLIYNESVLDGGAKSVARLLRFDILADR